MSIDRTGPGGFIAPTGAIFPYINATAPSDWLLCDGASVSRTTYANLFSVLSPSKGTCTLTIASPCVVTFTSHGLVDGDSVFLTTSGALPTGLSANTVYYAKSPTANTFNLSTTRDATTGAAGTAINTSGSQSGTHTLYFSPYGVPAGSSTNFLVPDMRGRTPVGLDSMGGSDAGRLSAANALGFSSGAETHTLSESEIPVHSHSVTDPTHFHYVWTGGSAYSGGALDGGDGTSLGGVTNTGYTGITVGYNSPSGSAHNNLQPYVLVSYIIKT